MTVQPCIECEESGLLLTFFEISRIATWSYDEHVMKAFDNGTKNLRAVLPNIYRRER